MATKQQSTLTPLYVFHLRVKYILLITVFFTSSNTGSENSQIKTYLMPSSKIQNFYKIRKCISRYWIWRGNWTGRWPGRRLRCKMRCRECPRCVSTSKQAFDPLLTGWCSLNLLLSGHFRGLYLSNLRSMISFGWCSIMWLRKRTDEKDNTHTTNIPQSHSLGAGMANGRRTTCS